MILEKQVCNLEISKKLKELGVKQESLYVWATNDLEFKNECYQLSAKNHPHFPNGFISQDFIPAFSVAELGEMLPREFVTQKGADWLNEKKWIGYKWGNLTWQNEDTEADARGKMLIYLIENNLIKLQ